ncbi:MAG: hypothetical protein J0L58_06790 [Burkholderiales bacterium]|nr:hypothetical protein [Burkholderiales bacterium]
MLAEHPGTTQTAEDRGMGGIAIDQHSAANVAAREVQLGGTAHHPQVDWQSAIVRTTGNEQFTPVQHAALKVSRTTKIYAHEVGEEVAAFHEHAPTLELQLVQAEVGVHDLQQRSPSVDLNSDAWRLKGGVAHIQVARALDPNAVLQPRHTHHDAPGAQQREIVNAGLARHINADAWRHISIADNPRVRR